MKAQDNYYWYDGLQQVTRHDRGNLIPVPTPPPAYNGISNSQQQENFNFDETGNWLQFVSQDPSWDQHRTHNPANQIASLTNPTGVEQPGYDPAGNMTTMPKSGEWTVANDLTWDAWNRLTKLTEGEEEITYAYDALTRRVSKTNPEETRNYYYDQQWRSVEERVSNTVQTQYVWSPTDRWTMIRRKRSVVSTLDETRFVLKDYLDPVAIIGTAAAVIERYGYDAFGPVRIMNANFATVAASSCDWNFLFHAEFQDLDTGLYNYGYRYYLPQLGKWPSRDPIGERGGINLFVFLNNEPTRLVDFLGQVEWTELPNTIEIYPPWETVNMVLNLAGEAPSGITGIIFLFDKDENITISYEVQAAVDCECSDGRIRTRSGIREKSVRGNVTELGSSLSTKGGNSVKGLGSLAIGIAKALATKTGAATIKGAATALAAEEKRLTPTGNGDSWKGNKSPCEKLSKK